MAIQQQFWLWAGDPAWTNVQAGPAVLILGKTQPPQGRPSLIVDPDEKGGVHYTATSSAGEKVSGYFPKITGDREVDPKWRGGVKLIFQKYVSHALPQTTYSASRMQWGQMAPPSAIHIVAGKGGEGNELWLGMGERAALDVGGRQIELGYFPERVILPFQIRLDHFNIDHYNGTRDPSSYASKVTVFDEKGQLPADISMNEPLHHMGTTLYQASYEDAMPRPVTSIFAVNRDPGRPWKYIGSLLIVLGSILLFAMKYRQNKKTVPSSTAARGVEV